MNSNQTIYLDYAAATPIATEVLGAMRPWLEEKFHNPSSLYATAREAKAAIEDARWSVAQVLGAKKTEIIFTAGGTESTNLAIIGVLMALHKVDTLKVVATAIEHDAVLACLANLNAGEYKSELVPVKSDGIVDLGTLQTAIDDSTVLVSVMYANNEIGTIQPIAKIGKIIAEVRADRKQRGVDLPIYFHTDAAQAAGLLDLHVSRLGIDLMSINGSKVYGPKQVGCLYVRTGTPLAPIIYGGGQERGLRSGTENVAGIVGLATALKLAESSKENEAKRLTQLRDYAFSKLKKVIPDLKLNGHPTKRLASNINLTISGIDGEMVVLQLDNEGIMVSTGSACSTGSTEPSHVLLAIGRSRAEANSSLRITFGRGTTKEEIDRLVGILPSVIDRSRQTTSKSS